MKVLKTLYFLLIANSSLLFSQDINKCRNIITQFSEAFNTQYSENLKMYLSEDFKFSKYEGEIAEIVLDVLFPHLNDKVNKMEELNHKVSVNGLEMKYNFEFEKLGSKIATFVFNNKGLLKEFNFLNLQMDTSPFEYKDLRIQIPDKNIIHIPFKIKEKFIMVNVMINKVERQFIFDSGSPITNLNSTYYQGNNDSAQMLFKPNAAGITMGNFRVSEFHLDELDFYGFKIINQKLLTLELSHLLKNRSKKNAVFGMIGFDIIKDFDILYDYYNKQITLINPDEFDNYFKNNIKNLTFKKFPLEMDVHLPIIEVEINGRILKLAIDCGGNTNLIDDDLIPVLKKELKKIKNAELVGVTNNPKQTKRAIVKNMFLGTRKIKNSLTVFTDISHLKKVMKIKIDGLLGYPFLSKQKILISYKRKEIMFLD